MSSPPTIEACFDIAGAKIVPFEAVDIFKVKDNRLFSNNDDQNSEGPTKTLDTSYMASVTANLALDSTNDYLYDMSSVDPDAQLEQPLRLQPNWLQTIINLLVISTFKWHKQKEAIIEELVKKGSYTLLYKPSDTE